MQAPQPVYTGKVRELYDAGPDQLVICASDNMSAFDVVLPTPIPDKGRILTALSLFWFDQLADLGIPNHVISADLAEYPPELRRPEWRGRSMLVRRLEMVQVECVARAYLAGSGTAAYRATGTVCGIPLPAGLTEGSRLPEPIFTPTTKGGPTGHDEPMTYAEVEASVGAPLAEGLRRLTLAVLERGRALCEPQGIIVADTKLEFGLDPTGQVDGAGQVGGAGQIGGAGGLVLADEVLTPDSSRFWPADAWQPGRAQPSFDKQPLRDWLESTGWDKKAPGPPLPDEVVEATRRRYVTAYERITGDRWN